MAYTRQDHDAVKAAIIAIAAGERVTEIRFSDRTVKYADPPSLKDLNAILAAITNDLVSTRRPFNGRAWHVVQKDKGL
jgi:hypothetical protein